MFPVKFNMYTYNLFIIIYLYYNVVTYCDALLSCDVYRHRITDTWLASIMQRTWKSQRNVISA